MFEVDKDVLILFVFCVRIIVFLSGWWLMWCGYFGVIGEILGRYLISCCV